MVANPKCTEITLRRMELSDLDCIMEIEHSVYRFPWSKQIFKDCLRVGYLCRVCERKGQLVGYTILSAAAGEGHILNICVKSDQQNQGIGREMMEHVLVMAKTANVETLFLEVRPSNTAAVRLYDSMGFNEAGIRKNYYPAKNGREDALILALSLLD